MYKSCQANRLHYRMLKLRHYQQEVHTDRQKKPQVAVTHRDKIIIINRSVKYFLLTNPKVLHRLSLDLSSILHLSHLSAKVGVRNLSPHLRNSAILRTTKSIAELRTKNVAELRLRTFKL
jgi:hypothetical protein